MKLKPLALFFVIFAAALISGCGGGAAMHMEMDEKMNEVRATAEEALRTANTADYNASVAKQLADEAMTMMQMRMMKGKMKNKMDYHK